VKFVIDESVSWRLARALSEAGHDAIHVDRIGLVSAKDPAIFERARVEGRVVVTQDIGFQDLVFAGEQPCPSVILLRIRDGRASTRARLILDSLPVIEADLAVGAVVVFEEHSVRVHRR
jgi:predicted nuclease of predicted toxin-antitoxin system